MPAPRDEYLRLEDDASLLAYIQSLTKRGETVVALDLEAENNLHAYGQKLALVQLFDGDQLVLIDALKITPANLSGLFESPRVVKVMFGASNDLSLVRNCLGQGIRPIIDLEPAVQLLAPAKQNLHAVIASELGITLMHKSRFQKHNWLVRPLSGEAIQYALNDVRYLLQLKDRLFKKLEEKGLFAAFLLRNARVQDRNYIRPAGHRQGNFGGERGLPRRQQQVAGAVYSVVDRYAARNNIPAFWIIGKSEIVNLVRSPRELNKLKLPHKMSPASFAEMQREIRELILPA